MGAVGAATYGPRWRRVLRVARGLRFGGPADRELAAVLASGDVDAVFAELDATDAPPELRLAALDLMTELA